MAKVISANFRIHNAEQFVEALSEATRRELIGTGLRITTIQPGDCATDLVKENTDEEALSALEIPPGAVVGEGWGNNGMC